MTSLTESLNPGDIFIAHVSNEQNPDGDGYLLKSTDKIVCWGAKGKLPVRYVSKTQGGDRLAVVPADETSLENGSTYIEQTIECCHEECANTVYLPKKYGSNPIFCSFECLKECRCGSAEVESERNIIESETKIAPDNAQNTTTDQVELGEHRTAAVSRFSSKGNAILQESDGSYNVGPLHSEALHEELEFVFFRESIGDFALCLNQAYWGENYLDEMEKMIQGHRLPPIDKLPDPTHSQEEAGRSVTDTQQSKECTDRGRGDTSDDTSTDTQSPESGREKRGSIRKRENETDDIDIESLRERAKRDSEENVDTKLRSQTTKEYTRSNAVRDYVLARAGGQCEGCGEPAPFTSKTGDPYLHAHHVCELSDGGSDTPDTVIALCPNCHYQVHHGEDGDKYNRELKEKLKRIEKTSKGE
jgi:5-methylcytosine-specific restriction endonuclease McrA